MSERFTSFDGTELAFYRVGAGRPVVLLHGLFSSAEINWIKFGHAQKLADAGFEAIMPDLRAHGMSAAPHDPAAYPSDVLVRDAQALVAHLGLGGFDLVGFSLGARTAARCVADGMAPRRLVIAGMGLDGLTDWKSRPSFFLDAIERFDTIRMGDPAYFTVQFMKTMKIDRVAAKLLLEAVGTSPGIDLARIAMPTLVLCGDEDRDNGSPEALAEALPDGHYAAVPGTHMSSVTKPDMGEAIVKFLAE
jgi:pimeloyl-ACP methyl ester carboxylesterase